MSDIENLLRIITHTHHHTRTCEPAFKFAKLFVFLQMFSFSLLLHLSDLLKQKCFDSGQKVTLDKLHHLAAIHTGINQLLEQEKKVQSFRARD